MLTCDACNYDFEYSDVASKLKTSILPMCPQCGRNSYVNLKLASQKKLTSKRLMPIKAILRDSLS